MRKIIVLLLFALILGACSQPAEDAANSIGTDSAESTDEGGAAENAVEDVPRVVIQEAPTPTPLPVTWTPEPMTHGGHLYATGSGGRVTFTGTTFVHIVQPGETLGILCERYGVSVADLAQINDIDDINHIEVGTSLVIPGSSG